MHPLGGAVLAPGPAREPRFTVVREPHDLCEYPAGSAEWRRESLHRHLNTEIQSLEIAAQSLVDFPRAPWELRLQHARQCWDESRHAQLIQRELANQGGFPGEFPIINFDWGIACAIDTLAGRLAVQNRTVEAGEMDLLKQLREAWKGSGDANTAAVMDGILADEIQHVRFAHQWIAAEAKRNPRAVLQVAAAIAFIRAVTEEFAPSPEERNRAGVKFADLDHGGVAPNLEDRRLAGFGDEDLAAFQAAR